MASFLADVTTLITSAFQWVGTVAATVIAQPVLLAFTAVSLVGLGVGLYKRLLSAN